MGSYGITMIKKGSVSFLCVLCDFFVDFVVYPKSRSDSHCPLKMKKPVTCNL